jgi:3-oxoacyl-[acyl-carrier protein] reductase
LKRKKVAIVTGASRGIGKAVALKLADDGFDLACFGRDKKRLKSLQQNLKRRNKNSLIFIGDVSDSEFVNKSIDEILKKYKGIDVLVNNAGLAIFKKFVDTSLKDFQVQLDVNVIGVFNFCKAVVNPMIKKQRGTIINIVSIAGKNGFQYGTTYASTKHAVMGFSKSLMLEVRKDNIRVIAICPGSVETEMIADSPIHKNIGQVLKPIDIADIVSFSVELPSRALISELDIRPNNP